MMHDQTQKIILLSSEKNCKNLLNQSTELSKVNICQVCGNKARSYNYGAISCLSCRAFFRRHGFRSQNIRSCPFGGQCEVRIEDQHRRACIACRLAKCLAAGMNPNYFRRVIQKSQKCSSLSKAIDMQICQYQSSKCITQLPTLDLLNRNRSSLNSKHWTLLSNIVHACDNFSPIPKTTGLFEQLSGFTISKLSDVCIPYEIAAFIMSSLVTLFRSIPDFQILTTNEQRSLLDRNMSGTCGFKFTYVTRDTDCIRNSAYINNYISLYGVKSFNRAKHFQNQLDSDTTIIKLMLIILTFSSNCSTLTLPENNYNDALLLGTFRLLGSQNVYVELLWKYMIYRYGDYQTVIRFSQLIKQVLDMMDHIDNSCMKLDTSRFRINNFFPDDKRTFINNPNEHIPLWGNT